jgi:hypothetical protein
MSPVVREHDQSAYRGVAAMGTIQRRKRAGIVETRVSGIVSVESVVAAFAELEQLVDDGAFFELVLHDDHALLDVDYKSGDQVAELGRAFLDTLRDGAIAMVAPDDVSYGRCRQIQIRLGAPKIEVEVFRRATDAKAWLDAKRGFETKAASAPAHAYD